MFCRASSSLLHPSCLLRIRSGPNFFISSSISCISTRLLVIFLVLVISSSGQVIDPNHPLVTTSQGRIRGSIQDIGDGKSSLSFIGIPFAAPPIRGYRFREPQPTLNFGMGELDATNNRVSCPQVEQRFFRPNGLMIREDEDCLYLNVFVPAHRSGIPQRYPVLVYYHGGEFKYGGKDYYKPDLLLRHDPPVILVVPNYRLGVLGFLSNDDNHCPGNYGIRDQLMALRWVRNEIHAFGGDPNAITIMGHDAGAVSVNIMMLSHEARGLFNRSIAVGGNVFSPGAFQEDPSYQARMFGRLFNCKHYPTKDLLRCLRDRGTGELMSAAVVNGHWFRPVVDLNVSLPLLTDYPSRLYERGDVASLPFLAGLTRNEGSLEYYLRYPLIERFLPSTSSPYTGSFKPGGGGNIQEAIEELIRPFLRRWTNSKVLASSIDYYYFRRFNHSLLPVPSSNSPFGRQYFPPQNINVNQKLIEMMGDFLFNAPTDRILKAHSRVRQGQTYLYVFSHQGSKSFGPLQEKAPREITRDSYGVTHMDDVFYILPTEYNPAELDQTGKTVASTLTRCLIGFMGVIPYNNPGCIFRPYSDAEANYLNFGSYQQPQAMRDFRSQDDVRFWNDMIDDLIEYTATPPPWFPYWEYDNYYRATWSLLAFLILFIFIVIILVAIICFKRREENRSLKLLRAREREFEERYNEQP